MLCHLGPSTYLLAQHLCVQVWGYVCEGDNLFGGGPANNIIRRPCQQLLTLLTLKSTTPKLYFTDQKSNLSEGYGFKFQPCTFTNLLCFFQCIAMWEMAYVTMEEKEWVCELLLAMDLIKTN